MRMLLVAAIALALTLPAAAAAQGWIEPHGRPDPRFGVVKLRGAVNVRVSGRVARVEVEEWFQNRGPLALAESDYLYPLPGEAVFSDFSLFQGDQELRGETMDAERARSIYEEIVRRKKDPALIELAGHGLIRARVFPINPGETRKITLRYTQLLSRAGDALHFRYAAGGRYGRVPDTGPETTPGPRRLAEQARVSFRLVAEEGDAFRDPFSPTHEVRVEREQGRLSVRPAAELEGDLSLFLPLARGLVGVTVATHKPSGEDGYFMLTLSPGELRGPSQPRDVTVVLDVSGSMAGAKIEQARQALRQLLGTLGREDRFRLIAFSSSISVYEPDWTPATAAEVERAREWVEGLDASGGTNIAGALAEAFRVASPEERLPLVVFLTDGLPSTGEQNPERIAQQAEEARGRARLFAFGVGYDVNTYLLDRLSAAGRGSTQYVQPGEDVEAALGALAGKIRHPVLTDLEIAHAPVRLDELYPAPLPDLFSGEELVIFGRYRAGGGTGEGRLTLAGRRSGRGEEFSVEARFPEHERGNDFIPRLWASRKIGFLMQSIRLNGPNPELQREIRETALRYGLLSEYTSYLVQEPLDVAFGEQRRRRMPMAPVGAMAPAAAPVPAPAQSTGRAAVVAAEGARTRREVRSRAELEVLEAKFDAASSRAAGLTGSGTAPRLVAGRHFAPRGEVWTDLRHNVSLRVVEIEPFSDAYFRLLRLAPELQLYWSSFERVLVAGSRVSIRVAPGGAGRLPEPELQRIVREFRGV
ncbi:MAG: VWA domain-containing protein [Gemmatimonadetes bacterium]|nr:VWA domain-containing protein [Gemmatimonadota bacterium]